MRIYIYIYIGGSPYGVIISIMYTAGLHKLLKMGGAGQCTSTRRQYITERGKNTIEIQNTYTRSPRGGQWLAQLWVGISVPLEYGVSQFMCGGVSYCYS